MVNKKNFVLDLDQTLISAEPTEEYDFSKNKEKAKKFNFHDMDGYYVVFERPGLQKFLTFLFDNFNVSIWTAASKDYALFVIDKIILAGNANRKLDYIFFTYHCDLSERDKDKIKGLDMLYDVYKLPGYSAENTVILDDYDEVWKPQKDNCIFAKAFEYRQDSSENDNFLDELIPYLRTMMEKSDVRPIVKEINEHFAVAKKEKKPKKRSSGTKHKRSKTKSRNN